MIDINRLSSAPKAPSLGLAGRRGNFNRERIAKPPAVAGKVAGVVS